MKTKELHHGSTYSHGQIVFAKEENLIGRRYVGSPANSGSLTPDHDFALECAVAASRTIPNSLPIIITFSIPVDELIAEGQVSGQSGSETTAFSTIHGVGIDDLPESYLHAIGTTKQNLIPDAELHSLEFFEVPKKYVVNHEVFD